MKKQFIHQTIKALAMLLMIYLAQSCSTSDDLPLGKNIELDLTAPIELSGSLDGMDEDTQTRGAGPITGTGKALSISLFRADETYTTSYTSGPHAATITTSATINTGLFYQTDPAKKTKLIGVYPAVDNTNVTWDNTSRKVTYKSIDGGTDILCSAFAEGSKNSTMSTMAFSHLLTQVKVTVICDANATGKWSAVNSVTIASKKQDVVVTLPAPNATGTATLAGSGTATALTVTNETGGSATPKTPTTTLQTFGYAMFAPVTTAGTLSLSIVTASDGTFTKTSASQRYEAGKSYELKLTFTATGIILSTVTIGAWDSGGSQNITL